MFITNCYRKSAQAMNKMTHDGTSNNDPNTQWVFYIQLTNSQEKPTIAGYRNYSISRICRIYVSLNYEITFC